MTLLEAALKYESMGYSVIPVTEKKTPLIRWEPHQKIRADEKQIRDWFSRFPDMNIAIVTGAISGLTVVDCDSSEAIEAFKGMVHNTFFTPMQDTPRGGRHYVCQYDKEVRNKAAVIEHMDVRSEGGYILAAPSSNGKGKSYSWVKGYEPWLLPPAPLPGRCLELIKNACIVLSYKDTRVASRVPYFSEGRRDEDLFHIANCAVRGGLEPEYVREVLIRLINSWGEHDEKWVEAKIKSAFERTERKERNVAQEVREWVMSTSGVFLSTEIVKGLQLSTRDDQKNISIILKRMRNENLVERAGNKNGCFRLIDQTLEPIDFLHALGEELHIFLPFEIEKFVKIFPKNIIVVAGEPNAGKTAFMLNVALENQGEHEVNVFSSEAGPIEMRERLNKFNFPLDQWTAKFWERSSDFPDVIRPNAINIVDFLEIHNNFWEIGGILKAIHDRLDKGIAVVALQKNPTRKAKDGTISGEVGLGGFRGLEKPRLYLTMSTKNVIKIVKAKNWRTEFNPNGYALRYSLAQGCIFRQKSKWAKAEDIDAQDKYEGVFVPEPEDRF